MQVKLVLATLNPDRTLTGIKTISGGKIKLLSVSVAASNPEQGIKSYLDKRGVSRCTILTTQGSRIFLVTINSRSKFKDGGVTTQKMTIGLLISQLERAASESEGQIVTAKDIANLRTIVEEVQTGEGRKLNPRRQPETVAA